MKTTFCYLKQVTLSHKKRLKQFLLHLANKENTPIKELTIVFCSNAYILNINKQFLNHPYFTDIITFDLTEKNEKEISAEIYISVDQVKSNAIDLDTSFKEELHRVVFHGLLHLCGFNDKTPRQKTLMTKKENEYLEEYFKIK
jgi:rRNA maturation RNase YbeY